MDNPKARRPNPYEQIRLHRMKRQTTDAVSSRDAQIVLLSCGGVRGIQWCP